MLAALDNQSGCLLLYIYYIFLFLAHVCTDVYYVS